MAYASGNRKVERAAQDGEQRYRALFNTMTEGFAVHELITDENGRPCDYRFIDLNPAFERLTGLKRADVIGFRVTEVLPGVERDWIEIYGKVVQTGESVHFERRASSLGRWYEVFAYRCAPRQFAVMFTDVTARVDAAQRAEKAMAEVQREKQRLEAIMQALPVGLAIVDREGGTLRVNHAFDQVWGGPRPVAKKVDDYQHYRAWWFPSGEPVKPAEWASARAVRDGETVVGQFIQIERFDGSRAFVLNSAAPILDESGEVTGSAVVIMDVTDRINAEAELEEAKRLLDALMENVPEGITIADAPEGRIRMVSRYGRETLGGSHDQMTIEDVANRWKVYRKDGVTPLPADELPLAKALKNGETIKDEEVVQVNSEGKRLTLSCNAAPITDKSGQIAGGVVVWRDITDRKRAEEAVRNSERLYRAIGESIEYGVWVCEPDGRNTYASESFLRLVGQTQEQYSSFGWADVLHPDDSQRTIAAWKECVRTGGNWDIEHRYRGVGGEYHWILARGVPVRDESGEVIYWAGINLDISRLKKAEQQLRELNETLEQRVAERTALADERTSQLRRAGAELTRVAQNERQRLAQVLHDDLQQTLVGAKFNLGVIEGRLEEGEIRKAIGKVTELLDQSLATSRSLTAELSPPVLEIGDLAQILDWLAAWAQRQYGLQVAIQFENEINIETKEIRYRLFRAVRELLLNVVKHAKTDTATVRVGRTSTGEIQVTVSDEGVGFDMGADGMSGSTRHSSGSGFGLFTIGERLEFLGGSMKLTSAAGRGTTVTLLFPHHLVGVVDEQVAPQDVEPVVSKPPKEPTSRELASGEKVIRVLLADDHAVLRDGLERLLRAQEGIQVVGQAGDGQEAVDLAIGLRPDVILMDVSMPRLNGVEATRQILQSLPETRVIGLSMHVREDVASQMTAAGAAGYLTKTVPYEVLIAAIRGSKKPRGAKENEPGSAGEEESDD